MDLSRPTKKTGKKERSGSPNSILAISIGVVYLWFGLLKFFPHLSPAENLAKNTIDLLTLGFINEQVSIVLLAIIEVSVGLLLVLNLFRKTAIYMALAHMAFTFTPLFFFADDSFVTAPFVPTLLGQYIGKNIIIVGALLTLLRKKETRTGMKHAKMPGSNA